MKIMLLNKNKKLILIIFILFGSFWVFNNSTVFASDCEDQCELAYPTDENKDARDDCEDTCKDLEKKAKEYEKIIDTKVRQKDSLNNQLSYINTQQSQNQRTLNKTNAELEELSQKITNIEKDIKQKEKEIAYQKRMLSVLMQNYYDYNQQGILEIVLLNESLANPFEKTDYIEQSGIKVSELLDEIKTAQQDLVEDKEELQDSRDQSEKLKDKLQDEKYSLQLTENQKQTLLVKTRGEEEKYQKLLAEIEEQKKQLFNFSSFGSYDIGKYDKPSSKDALSTPYYSQKDSRWAEMKIGVSSSKMKDYGCAITSVAMMYSHYGKSYTPKDILKKSDFAGDLIYWPSSWHHSYTTSYKSKLDSILKDDGVAIVHLKFSGGGHFIVVGGKDKKDYIVHDPYFGSNLYLGTSLKLLGAYVDRVIYK
jgi:peptidoglycan hydrolase CwlO-like protein